ncbi:MAG: InlB B-repeat-containing protein [Paludibacteraceae bacterium]|nr:InlB B-repeat-containing protein [Paludibacteraceae bacterium]
MLLTLGVGQMWGAQYNCNWRGNVFFRAPDNWDLTTNSVVQVAIVRTQDANTSEYVCMLTMERIGTTRLYYRWVDLNHSGWNQNEYLGFIANSSEWGNYDNGSSDRRGTFKFGECACYVTPIDWGVSNDNVPYLFNPTSESNGATLSGNYNDSGSGYDNRWYSLLDKAQTVNLYTSGSSSNAGGTVTIAGTYMSACNTTTATGSATSSSASVNYTTLIGSSVTLTATPGTGYQFDGWYTAGTGGSLVSSSNPYSYTCTGEATVYARFSELTYSLTFANSDGHGTVSVGGSQVASAGSSGSASVNYYTTKTLVATPSTGYNFSSWTLSGSNTSAVNIGSTTTASTTIKATNTGATVTANFTPKTYTVTLDQNGGDSNGSATATYNSSSLTSVTNASRAGYSCTGYWTATSGGTKVINANGTLVSGITVDAVQYTDASGNWKKDGNVTLYAQWTENATYYSVTFAQGTGYTSMGGLTAANTSTGASITSGNTVVSGTGVTFTASPNTGYRVVGFYSDAACTSALQESSAVTYATTISANTTVYVKFELSTCVITLDLNGGSAGSTSVTATYGSTLPSFTLATRTGYTLTGYWSATESGTKYIDNAGALVASTTYANASKQWQSTGSALTFHAQWSETMHTVSITNGTGSSTVGIATKATVTASAAATGKKFKQWNITGTYTLQDATTLTSREIHFTATTDISITAEYEDRDFVKVYFAKPSSWTDGLKVYAWDGNETPTYKNAAWPGVACTTTETVNCVTYYYYLYYTDNNGEGDDQTGAGNWTTMIFSDNGNDSEKTADLTIADGNFYRSASTGSGGTDGHDWYVRGTFNSVNHWNDDYPLEFDECGTTGTVTITGLTATSQSFKIYRASTDQWFKWTGGAAVDYDEDKAIDLNTALTLRNYNNNNNTFTPASTLSYTFTLNTTSTTNPVLTVAAVDATSYSTTMAVSGNGSTTPAAGSITLKQYTPTTITATPATGYYFTGWTEDGGHGISFASSSSATTTATATSAGGTVTANFAAQWAVVGGDSEGADSDDDEMGDWSTSANQITYIGTNVAGNDTGYVDITLPANTTYYFKVKDVSQASNSGWYGNSGSWTYANNRQRWDYTTAGSNSSITTAGAGAYRFSWNMSGNGSTKQDSLRIAFPTSYTVTFGYGTGGSAVTATVEDAITITSGQYAAAGKDITFTQTPATGYTFKGWYTASSGGTTVSGMSTSDNVLDDIAANANVYAQYTEDLHTVSITENESDWGTAHVTDGVATSGSAGVATSLAITAEPVSGYRFIRWTQSGTGTATIANDRAASTTVTVTGGNVTLTAEFGSNWCIGGKGTPFGNWDTGSVTSFGNFTTSDGVTTGYVDFTLDANVDTFEVKVRYLDGDVWFGHNTTKQTLTYADDNVAKQIRRGGSYQNLAFKTAGHGTYRFILSISATDTTLAIDYPTSYTITYHNLTWQGTDGATSKSESTTGGTFTVVDNDDNALTSGKYVVGTGSVTFTASPASNYSLEGWYSDETCETAYTAGAGVAIDGNTLTLSSLTADKTVYAKFAENMTTVTLASTAGGHIEIGGATVTSTTAGSVTTRSITAVPDAGYYFSGWTVEPSVDADYTVSGTGEANSTITLTGGGTGETTGQTLTANFVELNKIYFRNIFDDGEGNVTRWENVYVYFDYTWDYGSVKSSSNSAYVVQMTQIGTSDVYYAYVPRTFTTAGGVNVAFADHNFGTNYKFYQHNAAARGDYNNALNMFVPYHTSNDTENQTVYYSNGYWMKYDTRASQGAGYYLKVYNSRNNYTQKGEFLANTDDATAIQFQVRIDNTGAAYTRFMIVSAGGLNYLASATPTSTAYSDITLNEDTRSLSDNDVYFQMTATSEGYYTFIIDQTGDKMKLTVDYPVSPGDYRLKHTYTVDETTYTTYSDIIKGSTATESKTLSMYLNSASTSLVLQKCTEINSTTKLPTWSTGDASNLSAITTAVGTNSGVYQFDVTVNTSTDQVSTVNNIGLYTGNYYIKTDCADGGWVNYTQNAMKANTINATAAGYDYYFCKWIGNTTTNVKCVIANDYCNQLSDTLESDAILTRNDIAYQTLPYAANVRFSYNSATNELNRTYLLGSSDANSSFLRLKPAAEGYVYTSSDATVDLYSTDTKFKDNGNWTYQMDVYVYQGANGGVYTDYPTVSPITRQELVDTLTHVLMGGDTKGTTLYHVRLVYDFKTDYLMSAWMASGEQSTTIDLNSDFMYVRLAQEDADQLSFSSGISVTDAKKAYAAIEFRRDSMVNQMSSWTAKAYRQCMYYISFPFDVKVSDIFGIGEMGTDWRIQKYNGAKRAQIGWFAETETFWEDLTTDSVMHAYEGYSLLLNRVKFNNGSSDVWTNISVGGSVYLYFPSNTDVVALSSGTRTITIPTHPCTIDREFKQDLDAGVANPRNHKYTDSNWNMVGAPLFQNLAATNIATGAVVGENNDSTFNYVYAWNSSDNTLGVRSTLSTSFVFNSMYAYMVQYAGEVTFTGAMLTPASVAARRKAEKKDYTIELNLHKEETFSGRTYVELRENADDDYMLNEDMYMMRSSKTADLYTYAGSYDVAANVLSVNNHLVPVGVNVKSAGTYTFSMPSHFDGTVTLIDTYTQMRTNLAIEDYEVSLEKGEVNDRFFLELDIHKVPTAIDGVLDGSGTFKDGKAHKFIEDGIMYLMYEGTTYDVRGNKVK